MKGADVTSATGPVALDSRGLEYPNTFVSAAVRSCLQARKDKKRTAVLKALLAAGIDVNTPDAFYRKNTLHHAVNSSTDGADQNLDLEIALLRAGADVFARDHRKRVPLHYCFVKVRN